MSSKVKRISDAQGAENLSDKTKAVKTAKAAPYSEPVAQNNNSMEQ